MKIQLEYDLLSGEFSDVEIEPGKRSDQAYSATRTGMAQKNELYIRDLDIFVYKTLSLFKTSKDIIYHVLSYQLKYTEKSSKQLYLKQSPLN